MNLSFTEAQLPIRFRPAAALGDEDLLLFCAANDVFRIEREPNGEITVMTPAGNETSRMNGRITRLLDEWAEADGRGIAFDSSAGFSLRDGSMRNPDASWVSLPRWNALTPKEQAGFAPIWPEFIIELRSPSDRLTDLRTKMKEWLANGVELGWLIDPKLRVVEVYRPNEEPDIFEDPSSIQGTGPSRGFEIVLSRIWS